MRPPGRRALIVIGVIAFVFSVIVRFPAHVAARWFLPDQVQVSGVQGTLWRGNAAAVAIDSTVFGATQWRVRPLALFVGQLRADFDLKLPGGALNGQASATPGGKLRLRGLTGVVPLAALGQLIPTGSYEGRLGLDIDSAVIADGWLVDASGTVDIVDLRMNAPVEEALGNYVLTFSGAGEETLDGVFRETEAPVEAEGVLSLRADRTWELNGTISTTPKTPTQVSQGLAYLPSAGRQGQFLISFSGDF